MTKIRKSAKMQECQVRIPNICNYMPETVVLAHINGAGMGLKHNDIEAAYCCSACHDVLDRRTGCNEFQRVQLDLWFHEGAMRTRQILIDNSLLVIKLILSTSNAYKEGRDACFAGIPLNRNPYQFKKGVCNLLMRKAWERGFLAVENEIRGA